MKKYEKRNQTLQRFISILDDFIVSSGVADIVGSAYMLLMMLGFEIGMMGDEPYITVPALIISAIMIFVFNYFITFRKVDKKIRLILSLTFAIVTAPYTFLVPSSWLY